MRHGYARDWRNVLNVGFDSMHWYGFGRVFVISRRFRSAL